MKFEQTDKPLSNTSHKGKRVGKRGKQKATKQPTLVKVAESKPTEPKTLRETWEEPVYIRQSSEIAEEPSRKEEKLSGTNENIDDTNEYDREFEIPLNIDIEAEVLLRLDASEVHEPLLVARQEGEIAQLDIQPLSDLQHHVGAVSEGLTNKVNNEEALAKWREQRNLKPEQNYQVKELRMQKQTDSQPTVAKEIYEQGQTHQLRKEELPEEDQAVVERLDIPPEHRLEHSAWHTIEVDKKTGQAVDVSAINYGEAFRQEQKPETFTEEPSEVTVASGQLAVGNVASQTLIQNLTTSSNNQSKKPSYNSPIEATLKLSQHVATSADLWLWAVLGVIIIAIIASVSL